MYVLRIQHPVPDYAGWKRVFDSDPIGRRMLGVRRHRVLRSIDDPRLVMIDLEFDTADEARALLVALRGIWANVHGSVMSTPEAWIAETIETEEY